MPTMRYIVMLIALVALVGCISPKIEICNVKEACSISAPATVNPIQLPKVFP